MTFLQYISLLWIRFTPLEKRLLSEVRSVLPPAAQPIFDAQVSGVTTAYRPFNWNEICYYRKKGWKVSWDDVPMFPCKDEMELAEVRFKVKGKRYKATLFCIGHIGIFKIQPGGKPIAFKSWDDNPIVKLLDDPMRHSLGHKKPKVLLPIWIDFLQSQPAKQVTDWTLYDATTAYSISIEAGQFLILAEREGDEFILQRIEPPSDQLFYLENHDGTPEPLTKALESVVRNVPPEP